MLQDAFGSAPVVTTLRWRGGDARRRAGASTLREACRLATLSIGRPRERTAGGDRRLAVPVPASSRRSRRYYLVGARADPRRSRRSWSWPGRACSAARRSDASARTSSCLASHSCLLETRSLVTFSLLFGTHVARQLARRSSRYSRACCWRSRSTRACTIRNPVPLYVALIGLDRGRVPDPAGSLLIEPAVAAIPASRGPRVRAGVLRQPRVQPLVPRHLDRGHGSRRRVGRSRRARRTRSTCSSRAPAALAARSTRDPRGWRRRSRCAAGPADPRRGCTRGARSPRSCRARRGRASDRGRIRRQRLVDGDLRRRCRELACQPTRPADASRPDCARPRAGLGRRRVVGRAGAASRGAIPRWCGAPPCATIRGTPAGPAASRAPPARWRPP